MSNESVGETPSSTDRLFQAVYDELRLLARVSLANERNDHTLQATALVHEAYLRLQQGDGNGAWVNEGHFFGAASLAMRRILVDHARKKMAQMRGGEFKRVDLIEAWERDASEAEVILALSEAIDALEQRDPESAKLVELHCFAGLSIVDAAAQLGISKSKAYGHWAFAKAQMARLLTPEEPR